MDFPECGTSPSATVHIRQVLAEDLFIWRQQRDVRGSSRGAGVPRLLAGKNFPGREIGSENPRRVACETHVAPPIGRGMCFACRKRRKRRKERPRDPTKESST